MSKYQVRDEISSRIKASHIPNQYPTHKVIIFELKIFIGSNWMEHKPGMSLVSMRILAKNNILQKILSKRRKVSWEQKVWRNKSPFRESQDLPLIWTRFHRGEWDTGHWKLLSQALCRLSRHSFYFTFITLHRIVILESHLDGFLWTVYLQTTVTTGGNKRKFHHFRTGTSE